MIVRQSQENEAFRELCEHFVACRGVVMRLRSGSKNHDSSQLREYEALTAELEAEIRASIEAAGEER